MHQVGGDQYGPQSAVRCARKQQAQRPCLIAGNLEGAENEMVCPNRGYDAQWQDQRVRPALHRGVERDPVRGAWEPSPQQGRLQQLERRPPRRIRTHERHRGQAHRPTDSGHEASGDRIGNEAHQVGEAKTPDHETAEAGGDCADHERACGGDEQRLPTRLHRGRDRGHDDHERRRKSCNCAAVAAQQRHQQAGRKVAEEDQADALGGIGRQHAGEDETSEGHLRDEQPEAGGEPGRQRRNRLD